MRRGLAEEVAGYKRVDLAIPPNAMPRTQDLARVDTPDLHGDTECDDAFANTEMYRHTRGADPTLANLYANRARAWGDYYSTRLLGSPEYVGDLDFGLDHLYGWGLLEIFKEWSNPTHAAGLASIAGVIRDIWDNAGDRAHPLGRWAYAYGDGINLRQPARHMLVVAAMYELTDEVSWLSLLAQMAASHLARNTGWVERDGAGVYAGQAGGFQQVAVSHQVAQMHDALWRVWEVTGLEAARERCARMARFALRFSLDAVLNRGAYYIRADGENWGKHADTGPGYGPETGYWVNSLVRGYKLTADPAYLAAASRQMTRCAQYAAGEDGALTGSVRRLWNAWPLTGGYFYANGDKHSWEWWYPVQATIPGAITVEVTG